MGAVSKKVNKEKDMFMKLFKVPMFIVIGVSMLTLTGCTDSIDVCGMLGLGYFECLALGL